VKQKDTETEADDFFAPASNDEGDEPASKKIGKGEKSKKLQKPKLVAMKEVPSLLVASSNAEPQHFNLKSVIKAEKLKGKKLKQRKKKNLDELQEDFSIDVDDHRFKVIHDDHDFAIDPSNPHYKKTQSMKTLLDARTKGRANSSKAQLRDADESQSLQDLAESIKRKSASSAAPVPGKRRKLQ